MATLNSTDPHFVRCMKPNKEKVGDKFTADMMLGQLRYSGMLEVCRIRQLGYPVRRDNDEFFKRYKVLSPMSADLGALITNLIELGALAEGQFAPGTTKFFLKNKQSTQLEIARDAAFIVQAIKVQAVMRGVVWKFKFRKWHSYIEELKAAVGAREEGPLVMALDEATNFMAKELGQ